MKPVRILSSGLAGTAAVIANHRMTKANHLNKPDMDAVVKESFSKFVNKFRGNVPLIGKPFSYTLSEDTVNLSFYYNLSRLRKHKRVLIKAAVLGFAAGAGILLLPMILEYKNGFDKNSIKGKALIMGLNVVGAMFTASLLHFISTNGACGSKKEIRSTYSASQVIGFDEE